MRKIGAIFLLLAVAGCVAPSSDRGKPSRTTARPEVNMKACLADLGKAGAQYQLLPDRHFGPSCSATSSVKLLAVGIPVTNLGAVKCGMAVPFTRWVQESVQPAARTWLGSQVVKVESFGSYACRPINGMAGNKPSQHATANAVDIAAFLLEDGRRITVKRDWNGPDLNYRRFLRALHQSACRRFNVVLGPEANSLHHDHFHFDMGPGPYCR